VVPRVWTLLLAIVLAAGCAPLAVRGESTVAPGTEGAAAATASNSPSAAATTVPSARATAVGVRAPSAKPNLATPKPTPTPTPCPASTVSGDDARSVLGRTVTICFRVLYVRHWANGAVSLESREPLTGYLGYFGATITPKAKLAFASRFGSLDALRGRWVLVKGRVELYDGAPQIVLEVVSQLTVS
jgi:hypothetical protein